MSVYQKYAVSVDSVFEDKAFMNTKSGHKWERTALTLTVILVTALQESLFLFYIVVISAEHIQTVLFVIAG